MRHIPYRLTYSMACNDVIQCSTWTGDVDATNEEIGVTVDENNNADADEQGEDEADDDEVKHHPLPPEMLGCNTPRRRKETGKCWTSIKRLKLSNNQPPHTANWGRKGYTHVCIHPLGSEDGVDSFCNQPLKLHRLGKGADRDGMPWVTTHATKHLTRCHPEHEACEAVDKRKLVAHNLKVDQMLDVKEQKNMAIGGNDSMPSRPVFKRFTLSKKHWQLTRQARWYIYNDMKVSKRQFENDYFKEMLYSIAEKPNDVAILSKEQLVKYVHAEFDAFLIFLKIILEEKVLQSKGNLFAQLVHDGGTLASKKKYQGMALQFFDPKWRTNHVICTGFLRSYDGTDEGVGNLLTTSFKARTGIDLSSVIGRSRQDRAAKGKLILNHVILSYVLRISYPDLLVVYRC